MKTLFTLLYSMFLTICLAQPVVESNWLPKAGDMFFQVTVDMDETPIDPGSAGANVSYDFSGLMVPDDAVTDTFNILAASETPYADQFPDATLALGDTSFGFFSYVIENGGCLESVGNVIGGFAFQMYTDPRIIACTPIRYEDMFSDTYEGTSTFLTTTTYTNGTAEFTADGWGRITLPKTGQVISNVIRLRSEEIEIDSTDLGNGIKEKLITESTGYNFISADYKNVVFSITESTTTQIGIVDGLPNDTLVMATEYDFTYDPDPQETGTARADVISPEKIALTVGPNPTSDQLFISAELDVQSDLEIKLTDLNGRLVTVVQTNSVPGLNNWDLNLSGLAQGIYHLNVTSENWTTSQLVVKQ